MAKKVELLEGMSPETESKISLYFKNEGSDKEYHVQLRQSADGWRVHFQYGKRGSALRDGLKTPAALSWQEAAETYAKTVRGQLKDGYTENSAGTPFQDSPMGDRNSGLVPQLLNSCEEADFLPLADDDEWLFQEKFDGERLMMRKLADGSVQGINKKGLVIALPLPLCEAISKIPARSFVIDSEWLGERCAVFDLVDLDGASLAQIPCEARKIMLDKLIASAPADAQGAFIHVETACDKASKIALYNRVRDGQGEGVVGKKKSSPYESGRPNSGGNQLKRKFIESATLIAGEMSATKRSLEVYALDAEGQKVLMANVTLPESAQIPSPGELVEVHYLYCHIGGKLAQPVYKGKRLDQDLSDAGMGQLKYKRADSGPTEAPKKKPKL